MTVLKEVPQDDTDTTGTKIYCYGFQFELIQKFINLCVNYLMITSTSLALASILLRFSVGYSQK